MDDSRFDALTRSLTIAGSRRRTLGGLLAGTLGLLGEHRPRHAEAHDALLKCKTLKGDKKKKCIRKAKKHNAQHTIEAPPTQAPATCASPCATCQQCVEGACVNAPNSSMCRDGRPCTAAGDICTSAAECCVSPGADVGCQPGDGGPCGLSRFATCCHGYGGACATACDCCGRTPCVNGSCACPVDTQRTCDRSGQCACCDIGRIYCGGGCCPFGTCYTCVPFAGCRCL